MLVPARATKAEMTAYIQRDLERAEALVAYIDNPSHELPHLDAIYGLRARLALWNANYSEAATYAQRAIELTDTRPMTTEEMCSTTKGFNDLSCWMWGVQQTQDQNINGKYGNYASWMSPEHTEGYASLVPSSIGRSLYDRIDDNDPRKLLFIAPQGSALYGKTPQIDPSMKFEPYTALKFRPAGGETVASSGCYTAYPLMRVEEMYLIRAEALAHSDVQAGKQVLTDFMTHYRYASYTCNAANTDDLVQEIILQKRIELWGEGQSFFDFKRLGMSVTRDYEGTNFDTQAAFNTNGRPWWMNVTIPNSAITSNGALYGYENPQEQVTSQPQRDAAFVLERPAFLNDISVMPVSAYYVLLHAQLPERFAVTSEGLAYTLEVSTQPDFPSGLTVGISSTAYPESQTGDGLTVKVSVSELYSYITMLRTHQGLGIGEQSDMYLRFIVDDAISNAINVPIATPEDYNSDTYKPDYSYCPNVKCAPVGTIDCEAVAGLDLVKVLNMSIDGEGTFYPFTLYGDDFGICGTLYFHNGRDNFNLNSHGQMMNHNGEFNDNAHFANKYILQYCRPEYTFGDGYAQLYLERNGLVFFYMTTDSIAVSLKFNQQMIAEERHNWERLQSLPLTSASYPALNGNNIMLEQAEDDATLFRLNAPYQQAHNLMFTQGADGTLTMPRQMASSTGTTDGTVYVSGTGTLEDGAYLFDLIFTDAQGQVLSSSREQFGSLWVLLGTAQFKDGFWFESVLSAPLYMMEGDPSTFRLENPFGDMKDQLDGNQSPYVTFTILKAGDKISSVTDRAADPNATFSKDGYVFYTTMNTGYYYATYEQDLEMYHPASLYSSVDESHFEYQYVAQWQAEPVTVNGKQYRLPGLIKFAPYYYMRGVGGYNKTKEDGICTLTFPGFTPE